MTDDYKKGLVTGLAMQPLCVCDATPLKESSDFFSFAEGELFSNTTSGIETGGFSYVSLGQSSDINELREKLISAVVDVLGWSRSGYTLTCFDNIKIEFSTGVDSSGAYNKLYLNYKLYATNSQNYIYGNILQVNQQVFSRYEYYLAYCKSLSGNSIAFAVNRLSNIVGAELIFTKDDNGNPAALACHSQSSQYSGLSIGLNVLCGDNTITLSSAQNKSLLACLPSPDLVNLPAELNQPIYSSVLKVPNIQCRCMFSELYVATSVTTSLAYQFPYRYRLKTDAGAKLQLLMYDFGFAFPV